MKAYPEPKTVEIPVWPTRAFDKARASEKLRQMLLSCEGMMLMPKEWRK